MRYRLNGTHIGYINNGLIGLYRKVYNIKPHIGNTELIKEIVYSDILQTSFKPSNVETDISMLISISIYHGFKDPGEYIEYALHQRIEKRLFTCKSCPLSIRASEEQLWCMELCDFENVGVYPMYCYCKEKGNGIYKTSDFEQALEKRVQQEREDIINSWKE